MERVSGAFGFFFSFAIIRFLRMLIAELADILLICFAQGRETLKLDDPDIAAKLEEQDRHKKPLVARPIYEP
jgi:hypothetical protein